MAQEKSNEREWPQMCGIAAVTFSILGFFGWTETGRTIWSDLWDKPSVVAIDIIDGSLWHSLKGCAYTHRVKDDAEFAEAVRSYRGVLTKEWKPGRGECGNGGRIVWGSERT